jgi:hypothetical protein
MVMAMEMDGGRVKTRNAPVLANVQGVAKPLGWSTTPPRPRHLQTRVFSGAGASYIHSMFLFFKRLCDSRNHELIIYSLLSTVWPLTLSLEA